MGPERQFAGHQDYAASLKDVCRARGDQLPPRPWEEGLAQKPATVGAEGPAGEGAGRRAGAVTWDPTSFPQMATALGAALLSLPPTPSPLLLCLVGLWSWVTLCQVYLPPSHPTRHSPYCSGSGLPEGNEHQKGPTTQTLGRACGQG